VQVQKGQRVSLWTVCAGDPPPGELSPFAASLHRRWETGFEAMEARRQEDARACSRLGAFYRHLDVPDCIYRRGSTSNRPLYASEEALFGPIHPDEAPLVERLQNRLEKEVPATAHIVCPLSLGGHVDHRLTVAAVEGMASSRLELGRHHLWYYQDYPYAQQTGQWMDPQQGEGWEPTTFPISEDGLRAWGDAVAAHRSQISTFWPGVQAMRTALRAYARREGGIRLWRREMGD
jgi:LmbE family N-acetylglucosaminyl deacetylase